MSPDFVNAIFEGMGSVFILLNIRRILIDKMVRGADWKVMAFFTAWGYWNMYYYPHLDQWWSFGAGLAIALSNTGYVSLMLYYTRKERRQS